MKLVRQRRIALALVAGVLCGCTNVAAAADGATSVSASPLAANGFESPSCSSAQLEAQLSEAERTNCAVSGVAVAPVPLSNYAIDIDIPAGLSASSGEDIDSVVQDLFVTPVWTALVWLIHVSLIALEWCYSLDLLAPATLARAASVLGGARQVFTDPWLGLVLAVAAVGFAWQGLVRRRVLDTLGQAALLAVMVVAGLWIIADPSGTVGAVGGLADRAALATVAASATGDPSTPVATVDGAFATVFDSAISGPWCYLEFGDVDWCRDPAALDSHLRTTANRLETLYRAEASCRGPTVGLVQCAPGGSALQSQLGGAATALGDARTNGELFLALPAQALSRTALAEQSATPTLYGTLCGSSDPTACTAPTAPQAEFRSASGTWPRVGGLLLIVAGTLGMVLLLGFLALRLLGAALATLLYLLLAPLAVLAPALGEGGRDAFRLWITRLAGATLAKLVYSVALGVALLVVTLLSSLDSLGWWTQWLLTSVFWWTAFEQRHRLLSLVLHERSEPTRRAPLATRAWLAGRTAGAGVGASRATGRVALSAGQRAYETVKRSRDFPQDRVSLTVGPGDVASGARPGGGPTERERPARVRQELDAQVGRIQDARLRPQAPASAGSGPATSTSLAARAEVAALETRGRRIASGLRDARATGDRRRVVSLQRRGRRVAEELEARRPAAGRHLSHTASGPLPASLVRLAPTFVQRRVVRRALTRQLDLAARTSVERPRQVGGRDAPLSGLAGLTPAEYVRLPPPAQLTARLQIERELARRRELLGEVAPTRRATVIAGLSRRHRASEPAVVGPDSSPAARRSRQFGTRPR